MTKYLPLIFVVILASIEATAKCERVTSPNSPKLEDLVLLRSSRGGYSAFFYSDKNRSLKQLNYLGDASFPLTEVAVRPTDGQIYSILNAYRQSSFRLGVGFVAKNLGEMQIEVQVPALLRESKNSPWEVYSIRWLPNVVELCEYAPGDYALKLVNVLDE